MASERALSFPGVRTTAFPLANRWIRTFADAAKLLAQVAVLWGFSAGGGLVQSTFHLPVPGNVIGMCALFLGLACGALRLTWFELGGGFLTKHLAFFFVPVTVGVMSFGSTFARAGAGIAGALLISTITGLLVAGLVTQRLARRGR